MCVCVCVRVRVPLGACVCICIPSQDKEGHNCQLRLCRNICSSDNCSVNNISYNKKLECGSSLGFLIQNRVMIRIMVEVRINIRILSVEGQKGAITIQRCLIENQKSAIAIDYI